MSYIKDTQQEIAVFAGVKYTGKVLKLAEHRKKATEFIFSSKKQVSLSLYIYKSTQNICME